ncbi:hypothetical protein FS837_005654, partial [Tulasnella sp. UAMH 9824]
MSGSTAAEFPNNNGTLQCVPHPRYCDRREIFLLTGGTIYCIPQRLASERLVSRAKDAGLGESLDGPLPLENISTCEIESLLDFMNASWLDGKPVLTEGGWAAALYAATQLGFDRHRQHIINTMTDQVRGMEAFEALDLASKCQVAKWRLWALQELCERSKSLTVDEGRKLGFE